MTELPRFFQDPGSSFFLFGPRGTGKSTWLRAAFPEALWLDLLEPDLACAIHLVDKKNNKVIKVKGL